MRILTVFSQPIENNTSSMIRCRNVLNGFAEIGNSIVAYSPYPDKHSKYYGEKFSINDSIQVRRYGREVKTNTVPNVNGRFKSLLLKIYRKFDLFGSAIKYYRFTDEILEEIKDEKYDMLLSLSSPIVSHIISNKIDVSLKPQLYIQQWGDPLTADITRKTLTPKWLQKRIEKKLLLRADKVYYVSPFTLFEQQRLYPGLKDKMSFVPTPANKHVYSSPNNQSLCIGYFGSYYPSARNIIPLYEAVKKLGNVDLTVVGDSDLQLNEEKNIHLFERLTPDELGRYLEKVDIIVCLMNSKGNQIPGKTYSYACTNKEVLMILDGEQAESIKQFFGRYNRFTFCTNNVKEIEKTLQRYIA